jgi:hypothetical protein
MSVRTILYHPVSGKTNNLLLFFIALVPALVLFPFPVSVFANGIDPPLAWVFNFMIRGNSALGKEIIFPHGPLAFLMYPLPVGSNLWIAVAIHLAARIFMAYCLLKLATRKPLGYMAFALVSSFVLLAVNDLLLTLVQIIILCYLNFFERRNITWLFPALILTPLALYIKAFVGIVSMIITLSFAGIMIYRSIIGLESRHRLLLFLIIPFILVLVWLGLYGDLTGLAGYMKGMVYLAADNSAAVAVYPLNNWWITGSALIVGLILILINVRNVKLLQFAILAGPALFAIWKYGMAREDYLHTSMLFVFVMFTVLIYIILTSKFSIVNSVLSLLIIVLFYFTLQKSYYFEPFKIKVNGLQTLVSKALNNSYFADTCSSASEKAIVRNKLDKEILDLIGNANVDIYPWDYSYIAANNFKWQPRPVIQSYAAYTRELDQMNANHLESKKAPDFILWELRKITRDIHGGTLESIDGRYLLNDEPDALLAMLSRYELAAVQKGIFPVLVYKKRTNALKSNVKIIQQTKASWNTWIDVPATGGGIQRASVDMQRNLSGKIKSFVYKDEVAFVYYMLENGDIRMYRIVPKNAAYGLWINPLLINPENGRESVRVSKIMFHCSDRQMMKDEIAIRWEDVSFSQNQPGNAVVSENYYPVHSFFGISDTSHPATVLTSENNIENASAYWSVPDASKVTKSGRNASFLLEQGAYSVSFEYNLDSLSANLEGYIVRANVWAKAESEAKAAYVISVEKEGKSFLWKAVEAGDFIHDRQAFNFVTNYAVIDNEILREPGLKLKVYAWNTGKEAVLLDDFSVRIERR